MKRAMIMSALMAVLGTTANAAVIHPHVIPKKSHVAAIVKTVRPSARRHDVRLQPAADDAQLIGLMFGAAQQYEYEIPHNRFGKMRVSRRHVAAPNVAAPESSSSYEASPAIDSSSSSAADTSAAAIQSSNDQAAQDASVAAAEQQNEAAQAAAQQTENNANSN